MTPGREDFEKTVQEQQELGYLDFGDPNRTQKHIAFMSKTRRTPNPDKVAELNPDYRPGKVRIFTEAERLAYQREHQN